MRVVHHAHPGGRVGEHSQRGRVARQRQRPRRAGPVDLRPVLGLADRLAGGESSDGGQPFHRCWPPTRTNATATNGTAKTSPTRRPVPPIPDSSPARTAITARPTAARRQAEKPSSTPRVERRAKRAVAGPPESTEEPTLSPFTSRSSEAGAAWRSRTARRRAEAQVWPPRRNRRPRLRTSRSDAGRGGRIVRGAGSPRPARRARRAARRGRPACRRVAGVDLADCRVFRLPGAVSRGPGGNASASRGSTGTGTTGFARRAAGPVPGRRVRAALAARAFDPETARGVAYLLRGRDRAGRRAGRGPAVGVDRVERLPGEVHELHRHPRRQTCDGQDQKARHQLRQLLGGGSPAEPRLFISTPNPTTKTMTSTIFDAINATVYSIHFRTHPAVMSDKLPRTPPARTPR